MSLSSLPLSSLPLDGLRWMSLPLMPPQLAMHIPDGFLSLPVSLVTWAVAIALVATALSRVKGEYQERTVPLMGVCAAFIFAAQMINFPIPGGTSGHLLGGTLPSTQVGLSTNLPFNKMPTTLLMRSNSR